MKKITTLLIFCSLFFYAKADLVISGVLDASLPGGLPKVVEIYATVPVTDLSVYALGSANNGGGTDGPEYTFPAVSLNAGDFYYVTTDSMAFADFFGFNADAISSIALINGDDAVELFKCGAVIDVFGDINTDGTGQPWEYLDGWAYRNNQMGPSGSTFDINEWSFSGIDAMDGALTNATAPIPFPTGTYMNSTCFQHIYVDASAVGNNDGSCWSDAYTDLQDALAMAAACPSNIYIAEGYYYPTSDSLLRGAAFDLTSNTTLYGGYPAGGGARDVALYETNLSGDIDMTVGFAGNSYHVVRAINVTDAVLDGLSVRDGSADDDATFGRARGGGIFSNGSTITVTNCDVKWNKAVYGGGMFATLSPTVLIEESTFKKNIAVNGSALFHSNETNMYIVRSRIVDNNSSGRCAIEINNSLYTYMENSVVAANKSANANAIGTIATNRDQSIDINNCTIIGEAGKHRSLITMQIGFGDQLDVNINNSVIAHQDSTFTKNVVIFNNNILNLTTNNCYIQGSSIPGTANNNLYSMVDGFVTFNADFSAPDCSIVVDAGDDLLAMGDTDIDGNARISGLAVDIGAYESAVACREEAARLTNNDEFNIFPNPTSGEININTTLDNITTRVFDILGQNVLTSNQRELNISSLPSGTYILNVYQNDELIGTEKLLKR